MSDGYARTNRPTGSMSCGKGLQDGTTSQKSLLAVHQGCNLLETVSVLSELKAHPVLIVGKAMVSAASVSTAVYASQSWSQVRV